jgi:hypothetical protein
MGTIAIRGASVRRLVVVLMVIGLIWVSSAGVVARQDGLSVIPSAASTDSELAGLFPVSVGYQPVPVEIWSGAQWVAGLDPDVPDEAAAATATESLLAEVGSTLDEVEVARASVDLGQDGEVTMAGPRSSAEEYRRPDRWLVVGGGVVAIILGFLLGAAFLGSRITHPWPFGS